MPGTKRPPSPSTPARQPRGGGEENGHPNVPAHQAAVPCNSISPAPKKKRKARRDVKCCCTNPVCQDKGWLLATEVVTVPSEQYFGKADGRARVFLTKLRPDKGDADALLAERRKQKQHSWLRMHRQHFAAGAFSEQRRTLLPFTGIEPTFELQALAGETAAAETAGRQSDEIIGIASSIEASLRIYASSV